MTLGPPFRFYYWMTLGPPIRVSCYIQSLICYNSIYSVRKRDLHKVRSELLKESLGLEIFNLYGSHLYSNSTIDCFISQREPSKDHSTEKEDSVLKRDLAKSEPTGQLSTAKQPCVRKRDLQKV
nr:uncharacterized protein LOC109618313 [Crassostrea gigas]